MLDGGVIQFQEVHRLPPQREGLFIFTALDGRPGMHQEVPGLHPAMPLEEGEVGALDALEDPQRVEGHVVRAGRGPHSDGLEGSMSDGLAGQCGGGAASREGVGGLRSRGTSSREPSR